MTSCAVFWMIFTNMLIIETVLKSSGLVASGFFFKGIINALFNQIGSSPFNQKIFIISIIKSHQYVGFVFICFILSPSGPAATDLMLSITSSIIFRYASSSNTMHVPFFCFNSLFCSYSSIE